MIPAWIPAAFSAAGAFKDLFGGEKGSPEQNVSGYGALPEWAQNIFQNQYGPGIGQFFGSQASQQVSPQNAFQQQALGGFGGGIEDIMGNLGKYMNPYQQHVTDKTNREYDINRSNIMGALQGTGRDANRRVSPANASSLQLAQSQNEEARQRALSEHNYNNYNQSLGLRRQTLQDMLSAGNVQRGFAEEQRLAPFARLQQLSSLLNPLLGGSFHQAAQTGQPNMFSNIGTFGNLLNQQHQQGAYNDFFSNGAPNPGEYGPPQPGMFQNFGNFFR